MKTKTLTLKLSVFLLFLFASFAANAQTPQVYLCGTGQAVLIPDFGTYTLVAGDRVIWSEIGGGGAAVTSTFPASPNFTTPAGLSDGAHTYKVSVIPADVNACPGDASDDYVVYKLPTTTIALNSTVDLYCTDAPTRSVITAAPVVTPPTGVTFDYVWSATLGGTAVDITTLGSASGSTFSLQANVTPGAYTFTAVGTYNTGAVPIRPAASCATTSSTKTITVTAKPGKPTISIQ